MANKFELIDLTSGNVVGDFGSEGKALDSLRQALGQPGVDSITDYSLVRVEDERQSVVAMQDALVRLVTNPEPLLSPESRKVKAGG